jgi:hypothetical protein
MGAVDVDLGAFFHVEAEVQVGTELIGHLVPAELVQLIVNLGRRMLEIMLFALKYAELRLAERAGTIKHISSYSPPGLFAV